MTAPTRSVPLSAVPAFVVVGVLGAAGLVGAARTSVRLGVLGEAGTGLDAWRRVLGDPAFARSVGFTLWVAAMSTAVAVVAAVAVTLAVRRRRWVAMSLGLPVATPHLVVAALAVQWAGPGGLLDRAVGGLPVELVGDRMGWGIIAVYAAKETPFLVLLALAALDPATVELEHSAAMMGAGRRARLRDVILPRLAVPLMAGGLVVSAFVVGAVEVPLVVGPANPDLLGPYALQVVETEGPAARSDAAVVNLVAAAIVALVGAAVAWAGWWRGGRRRRVGGPVDR